MSVTTTITTSRGPVKWAAIGVLGGAALMGSAWAWVSRTPQPAPVIAAAEPTKPAPPQVIVVQVPAMPLAAAEDDRVGPPANGGAPAPVVVVPEVVAPAAAATPPDKIPTSPKDPVSTTAPVKRININTASADELDLLPGVGKATALAIIEHRTKHGPFRTVSDLDKVPGIGPSRIEKLRPLVIVD